MASERLKKFICSSVWSKNLTEDQVRRVENEAFEMTVSAGQIVCRRGERADHWYGVAEGLVKVSNVSRSGRPTTFIGIPAGGWLGEGSVLKRENRPYDVVALRDSRLVLVPSATFHWLLDTSLPFNRFLIDQLNARLGQFVLRLEHARSHHPEMHVAHCLAELFNAQLYPGTATTLEISQEEISFLAGVSRQLVNRALHRLEEAQLIEVKYGSIKIIDVTRFCAFVSLSDDPAE